MTDPRSRIPGLDRLLLDEGVRPLLAQFPRPRVAEALRGALDAARTGLARGEWPHDPADEGPYVACAAAQLEADAHPSLKRVVNATGVVLHTNLGRAPLAPEARAAMVEVATAYSNLEFDLDEGRRGSRYDHCRDLVREQTGAEDAVVVNNCAAALVLVLNTLAGGRGVVVSRGELVEIGGGFRIPDMLGRAGCSLREVGSTNRTRVGDYAAALDEGGIGAVLKVHRSNFRITGFTESVDIEELVGIASEAGVPLVHDVGSGLLLEPDTLGLPHEPTAARSIAGGADIVVFSGDKLLGGPQAGVVAGRREWVEAVRHNPLCRAMRVDKATLAALEATLRLYRDPATVRERVPVLRMLTLPLERLEQRAARMVGAIAALPGVGEVTVADSIGRVGGGTYPDHELPARVVRLSVAEGGVEGVAARLRRGRPAVVGRVVDDALLLDPRTMDPSEDAVVVEALRVALAGGRR